MIGSKYENKTNIDNKGGRNKSKNKKKKEKWYDYINKIINIKIILYTYFKLIKYISKYFIVF
jgi:hypothetical protein